MLSGVKAARPCGDIRITAPKAVFRLRALT
jgi:hypothetical protein